MGFWQTTKNYISTKANAAGQAVANTASDFSGLSPNQVDSIKKKREEFYRETEGKDLQEIGNRILTEARVAVSGAYLSQIRQCYVPIENSFKRDLENNRDLENYNLRYVKITRWVTDIKENSLEKLINVYEVLSKEECTIGLIFHRRTTGTDVYLGVVNEKNENSHSTVDMFAERLKDSLKGNFPGAEFGNEECGVVPCLDNDNLENCSVAAVSNIPAEKSKEFISQTIEKLLDGSVPDGDEKEYTVILLAKPVLDVEERKLFLQNMYSKFSPYASWQKSYSLSESKNCGGMFNLGAYGNIGGGNGSIFAMVGVAATKGYNEQLGAAKSEGMTQTFANFSVQHMLDILKYQVSRYDKGTALGMWDFAAYVVSKDFVVANNVAHSYLALTQGDDSYVSQAAINLWRGDVSEEVSKEGGYAKIICSYLRDLRHPEFCISEQLLKKDEVGSVYPPITSATTCISGKELSYALNFPKKSVEGMPVIECAEFGRNISTYEDEEQKSDLEIGKIYHMHKEEKNFVGLSKDSLASHVFVTGSTGVGKSNTVYKLLEKAVENEKVKFMVVEPAKGEYKDKLGRLGQVKVFGTNPELTEVLRINPFSFPKNIHVTEHIDRLVELFNVCWPMYAAMPAVLKDAVERAYKDCGWDLATSKNEHKSRFYPSFRDVADNVKKIIDKSDYDVLNKGAYKGALITRLQSLTNGINGLIFVSDELSDKDLFEKNVIIDLSRIGSQETKSLIMGMMVLKLQEYHLDKMDNDSNLKHITVLEEAHNLLKRSAIGGIEEGGNLQGKSVEMISNAIAEMRTYGEGFVIVDQAPGLLDMAAIRNTNTKIILRLPDLSDRELVGRAANLNDDQISELARLPRGVAAIYHNEWIEPVLCKVAKFENSQKCDYGPNDSKGDLGNKENALEIVKLLEKCERLSVEELEGIKLKMHDAKIRASVQVKILSLLKNPFSPIRMRQIAPIVSELYSDLYEKVKLSYQKSNNPEEWTKDVDVELRNIYANNIDEKMRRIILHGLLLQYLCYEVECEDDLQRWVEGRFVR